MHATPRRTNPISCDHSKPTPCATCFGVSSPPPPPPPRLPIPLVQRPRGSDPRSGGAEFRHDRERETRAVRPPATKENGARGLRCDGETICRDDRPGDLSFVRRPRDKSARDEDLPRRVAKKKRLNEGRSASNSARLDDSDDDARARRITRKREAKAQQNLSRAVAKVRRW